MRTIPLKYRLAKHRWDYELIERNNCAAIYSQSRWGKIAAYEVYLLRFEKAREIAGVAIEGGERIPRSDEDWGRWGWTCGSLARAREKFAELSTDVRKAKAEEQRAEIGLTSA